MDACDSSICSSLNDWDVEDKVNFTFSGCGFLGVYHIGVIACLKQHAPKYLEHVTHYGGASAGALSACALLFNMDLEQCVQYVMKLAGKARSNVLGPFSQSFDPVAIIRKTFMAYLPDNAHEVATGKLHISMTRVSDWKNCVISEFKSKKELVDALSCTTFVPFYSGILPPKYRGEAYVDGGFTDNLPQHFEGTTITVSPFSGESDICPDDVNETLFHFDMQNTSVQFTSQNLYRMSRAFLPPSQEILGDMCRQGFKDALKYLHFHYPDMLNIGIARVKIPDCCVESHECDDNGSGCSCDMFSDVESTISAERLTIVHNVVPEKLNEILLSAKEVMADSDIILWHMIRVLFRVAKWMAKPCIYTVQHIIQFVHELAHWLIPKVQEISNHNYYTKTALDIALDVFNTYKDSHQCERHPSLKEKDFTDLAEASAKLQVVQKHMRVVPIDQSQSRRRLPSTQSMYRLPQRQMSLPVNGSPPMDVHRECSSLTSTPVEPPNMSYLGLSPRHHALNSEAKRALGEIFEAADAEKRRRIFQVGSCKMFDKKHKCELSSTDSYDEFMHDFVFLDGDESDCDFH